MTTLTGPTLTLTAGDVMGREVLTLSRHLSLRAAARLLRRAQVSGAPVVDEEGRCVGVLSVADLLRWADEGCPGEFQGPLPSCAYQERGRLLSGEAAVLCTLEEGKCPLQVMRPVTGGRHAAVCRQPEGILSDWQVPTEVPACTVGHYMTTDTVTVGPWVPLHEVARMMVDAHIHRVPVLDEEGRPVGIVSSTDVLAAVARDAQRWEG